MATAERQKAAEDAAEDVAEDARAAAENARALLLAARDARYTAQSEYKALKAEWSKHARQFTVQEGRPPRSADFDVVQCTKRQRLKELKDAMSDLEAMVVQQRAADGLP